jgi:hypothetical protein
MTSPAFLVPQSASASVSTNLRRDEYAAMMTTDHDLVADQRGAAIGNSIPLVFCRQSNGEGGVWVTPPAVRYGGRLHPTEKDRFAFGLVLSDGKIGEVAIADVRKGASALTSLEGAMEFRYGSLATAGFDYTLVTVKPGSPEIPVVPGYWVSKNIQIVETHHGVRFDGRWNQIPNCTALSAKMVRLNKFSTMGMWYDYTRADGSRWTMENPGKAGAIGVDVLNLQRLTFPRQDISFHHYGSPYSADGSDYTVTIDATIEEWVPDVPGTPAVPDDITSLPLYPGSGGSFAGLSTLAVKGLIPVEAEKNTYRQQVRVFVRNGVEVTNVLTGATESSHNFADLAFYLLSKTHVNESALLDRSTFQEAAVMTANLGMYFNGVLANSVNVREYLAKVAPMFLTCLIKQRGKFTLRPLYPTTSSGSLSSSAVVPAAQFDGTNIVAGSYNYVSIDRSKLAPFQVSVTWRSQTIAEYSVSRATEVKYKDCPADAPFEQYDMEEFCVYETHAIFTAKHLLALRKHVTHMIAFQAIPSDVYLDPLDIIQVTWGVESTLGDVPPQSRLYQIDTITRGPDGVYAIEATHFPTTSDGKSLVVEEMLGDNFTVT